MKFLFRFLLIFLLYYICSVIAIKNQNLINKANFSFNSKSKLITNNNLIRDLKSKINNNQGNNLNSNLNRNLTNIDNQANRYNNTDHNGLLETKSTNILAYTKNISSNNSLSLNISSIDSKINKRLNYSETSHIIMNKSDESDIGVKYNSSENVEEVFTNKIGLRDISADVFMNFTKNYFEIKEFINSHYKFFKEMNTLLDGICKDNYSFGIKDLDIKSFCLNYVEFKFNNSVESLLNLGNYHKSISNNYDFSEILIKENERERIINKKVNLNEIKNLISQNNLSKGSLFNLTKSIKVVTQSYCLILFSINLINL